MLVLTLSYSVQVLVGRRDSSVYMDLKFVSRFFAAALFWQYPYVYYRNLCRIYQD